MIWVGRITTFLLAALLCTVVQKFGVYLIRAETSYGWREAVGCLLVALSVAALAAIGIWAVRWFRADQ